MIIIRQFANKMSHMSLNNNVPLKKRIANGLKDSENILIVKCDSDEKEAAVTIANNQLTLGNVIALPTDTIYGLACNANDPHAIEKLYDIKGRSDSKPVAICVANITDLKRYGEAEHLPNELLNMLLPGAVTIVLNRSKNLDNPYLNPGTSKIGIRIPDLDFLRLVSTAFAPQAIALTSANRSGAPSTLAIDEFEQLWPQLGAIFDGGCIGQTEYQRAGSTVVDLSEIGFYRIIRNGIASKKTAKIMYRFGLLSKSVK